MKAFPIILAGGSGTRLWPLSRELYPKQVLKIEKGESLISQTVKRCKKFTPIPPHVVTLKKQVDQITLSLGDQKVNFIEEPMAKNTAAAIVYADSHISKSLTEDYLLVILSADHYLDEKKFKSIINVGVQVAKTFDGFVLIGIKPTRPETGFGYIERGRSYKGLKGVYRSSGFKEKPNIKTARGYLKSKKYLWNTGIFIVKHSALVNALEESASMLANIYSDEDVSRIYGSLTAQSIDYALLEKLENIVVVEADMKWDDLGNWSSVRDVLPKDNDGNYGEGKVISIDNKNTMILSNGNRLIGTVGLENITVVDTEDSTLICNNDRSQEVKQVVAEIVKGDTKENIEHKTSFRPWGRYTVLDEGPNFKVKFIHVIPGGKLSLQMHEKRSEHWVAVKGRARVTLDTDVIYIEQNESVSIPVKTKHRLENDTSEEITIVEVSSGSYIGEDDIIRFEDIYSRIK